MPLFGKSQKSPAEIVRNLKDALTALERGDKKSEKLLEDVARSLQSVKGVLYGSAENEPQTELVAQLAQEAYSTHLIPQLVTNLAKVDFEVRISGQSAVKPP